MSVARRNINGETGEYTVSNGDYLDDNGGVQSKAILALRTRHGTCAADPELGSKFHTLRGVELADRLLARAYAFAALRRMIVAKEIRRVTVVVEPSDVQGRLVIKVDYENRVGSSGSVVYTTGT